MVFDSRFIGSNVYYHDRYHNNTVLSQCTLEAAKSIDKELLPEDWWYDY
jgi:hypothetical protein